MGVNSEVGSAPEHSQGWQPCVPIAEWGEFPEQGAPGAKRRLFRGLTRTERQDFLRVSSPSPEKKRLMAVESAELTKAMIIY